ncbi:transcriptional repressor LexA [Nannocystis bainbridge]|uniref:LexA repressor n=1 Tax=Nannocystis bainbridge TaxID=2995303 RepID=A0ABT5DX67_9BACT|nr:transcriptional repressor LexA [Nannocystis bainbridge]MDC0717699.1 transcriptional repressor LexA [Nannocystis bainbridge]
MKPQLTHRQQQALDFISSCLEANGYPPTLREIGEHMGIRSTNGVNDHLKALERKGYLLREELKSRALRPVDAPESAARARATEIPILGRVAAGQPILADENVTNRISVDQFFLHGNQPREVFGLVVHGESMIEDGIFDGDYVFVRRQANAERGEIVVAMIEGEVTCKRYYLEGDRIRLQPGNAAMQPIFVHRGDHRAFELVGKVIGVYRSLH